MQRIDETTLNDLVIGSTILGAGGGGDPYVGKLLAREAIRQYGPVTLLGLDEISDDAQLVFLAGIGAPGVLIEKLPRAREVTEALRLLERYTGVTYTHVAPAEAGGLNAITPFTTAAELSLPVVDADGMGRAFPALELVTPTLYGGMATPMAWVDEHGNRAVFETATNQWAEKLARTATVASGCIAMLALFPMTGAQAKERLVRGALSLAIELGRTLRDTRAVHASPVDAIIKRQGGVLLHEGKVRAVERRNERGWTIGEAHIEGSGEFRNTELVLHFQNEHLVAIRDGQIVATVPDLIMALSADTGEPIPAEEIRYGYRVAVVGLPCDSRWRSEAGLAIAGPRRFGYDVDYIPIENASAA